MHNFPSKPIKPFKKYSPRNPDYLGIGAFILFFIILGVFVPVLTEMFSGNLINNYIICSLICLILIIILNLRQFIKYGQNVKIKRENQKAYDILMTEYNKEMIEYDRKLKSEQKYREELDRKQSFEVERQKKIAVITPDKEMKVIYQKSLENWKKNSIENLKDSTSICKKNNQIESEINNTIRNYSISCAVLAIQPIPFADIFILTPTQILMGKKIASLRGYEIKENSIESILKEISGIIGMGIIAQQLVIGAYKTFLPFFGGITTIPVVYGLTYGIGKTMDYYIVAKINGTQINKSEIEKIFKASREIGERVGKSQEKEIQAKAKK
jgi:uncharacterized protein (DUF697 family)